MSEHNPYAAVPPAQPPYPQQQSYGHYAPYPQAPHGQQWYQPWPPGAYPMPPAPPAAGPSPARKVLIGVVVLLVVGISLAAASSEQTTSPSRPRPAADRPRTVSTGAPAEIDAPADERPGVLRGAVIPVGRDSGTRGATYDIGVPVDFVAAMGNVHGDHETDNVDVTITSPGGTMTFSMLSYKWPELPNGVLPPEVLQDLREDWLSSHGRKAIKGHKPVLAAGVRAVGVDYTQVFESEGGRYRCRLAFFGRGGTLYTLQFCSPEAAFARQAVTMDRIAGSITFTGPSNRDPDQTASA